MFMAANVQRHSEILHHLEDVRHAPKSSINPGLVFSRLAWPEFHSKVRDVWLLFLADTD